MKYITIHCSATRPKYRFKVDDLRWLHVNQNGWSDIGYHYYIDREGIRHECRPLNKTGAHVRGYNAGNIGVCLEGGLSNDTGAPQDNFTPWQYEELRLLVTELQGQFGIKDSNVKGHRDWFGDTNKDGVIDSRDWLKECPCFDVKQKLEMWK